MPEMTFDVRWPDGGTDTCYSPSLVMHDHLAAGTRYTVADFVRRADTALAEAAERVRAKYGFYCTSAAETREQIRMRAAAFTADAHVDVVAMEPALESA